MPGLYNSTLLPVGIVMLFNLNGISFLPKLVKEFVLPKLMPQLIVKWLKSTKLRDSPLYFSLALTIKQPQYHTVVKELLKQWFLGSKPKKLLTRNSNF